MAGRLAPPEQRRPEACVDLGTGDLGCGAVDSRLRTLQLVMRGGKRAGAGRKPGPQKKQLTVRILPETHREINRRSARHSSIGALMDETFKPKLSQFER